MIKIIIRIMIIALLIPVEAIAQDTFISAAQVLGYGVFTGDNQGRKTGFTDAAPASEGIEDIRFTSITNKIVAKSGIMFGVEYMVNTNKKGRPLDIVAVITFPEPGLVQPNGRTYKESRQKEKIKIGEPAFYGYGFDEEWEKVPGEWVFEIFHKKARLVKQRFHVSLPEESD